MTSHRALLLVTTNEEPNSITAGLLPRITKEPALKVGVFFALAWGSSGTVPKCGSCRPAGLGKRPHGDFISGARDERPPTILDQLGTACVQLKQAVEILFANGSSSPMEDAPPKDTTHPKPQVSSMCKPATTGDRSSGVVQGRVLCVYSSSAKDLHGGAKVSEPNPSKPDHNGQCPLNVHSSGLLRSSSNAWEADISSSRLTID